MENQTSEFRIRRDNAGMTQVEAAARLGVTQGAVWQWEQGATMPSAKMLPKIARLYGCTVDELLCTSCVSVEVAQ